MDHGHTAQSLQAFELEVAEHFNAGKIRAPVHLSGGNEEPLLDIFKDVGPDDYVCTAWRSHYHCLLKGVPPARLMADILEGRSITLTYPDFRIISSAIVGGVLPIALGIALAIKGRKGKEFVHCFLGDMTAETGGFSECVKYAANYLLPIRWIVEHNGKSVLTDTLTAWRMAEPSWAEKKGYDKDLIVHYGYSLPWPHAGAGKRVQF